jgi:hypothetical protein
MNTLQLQFLMLIFAGWVNRSQQDIIEYLQEENRVLREQLGGRRLRFTDRQRRGLAAKAKAIGRKGLFEIASQGKGNRPQGALRDRQASDARHVASMAPEANRQEV